MSIFKSQRISLSQFIDQGFTSILHEVLSLLEACFDLMVGSSLHMKMQIMGGKILKIWGSNSLLRSHKVFCPVFFSFSNSFFKPFLNILFYKSDINNNKDFQHVLFDF